MWEQVEEDDPKRCQAVMPTIGQCRNKAVEGSQYCYAHGGNKGEEKLKRDNMNNFRINQYRERAEELNGSDKLTSLKDEVTLLRILIEERWNRCGDQQELLLSSGPLSDLIMKSSALVEKCHKLDSRLGNLLDRSKVMQFAQVIIEIISQNITDPEILETVSNSIEKALNDL